ncbi:hypothetical protein Tco_0381064 [Tanacetum coccineum]
MTEPYYGLIYLYLIGRGDIIALWILLQSRRPRMLDGIGLTPWIAYKMTSTRTLMSREALEELISQRVADALATYDTNWSNDDDSHDLGSGERRTVHTTRDKCIVKCQVKFPTCTLLGSALTWWNSHVRTVGQDAAYALPWKTLMKMMTKNYCLKSEIKKLEI